jgi:pimeloyl-ACP methyl ester carboxylesterase
VDPSLFEPGPGLRDKWPFLPRFATVNGWRMHYVDEGEGDPVVLLHGNPTWGFLYRDMIGPIVESGRRVIVPDMIGFGLSEKPSRDQAHTLDGHIANLAGLVRQLDLNRVTLVCHDWGGPTGLSFAMSDPQRVRSLVVMSTWAWPDSASDFHKAYFPWRMLHAPLVGPYLLQKHNVLAGRGVYLSVVDRDRFRGGPAPLAYGAVLPDMNSRLLTLAWPRWIPLDEQARAWERFSWLEDELSKSKLPTLIVWGREDEVFDPEIFARRFKRLIPHAQGPMMVTGRHFLQEDSAADIAGLVIEFVDRLDQKEADE